MMQFRALYLVVVLMAALGISDAATSHAQLFPYAVPEAPEFDRNGEVIDPGQSEAPPPRAHRQPQTEPVSTDPRVDDRVDYRTMRPHVQQDAQPAAMPPQPRPRQSRRNVPPPGEPPQMMNAPGARPQPQVVGRPDCSRYPMIISYARSDAEMQAAAREYLRCLIDSGWPMEQAKQHVISTIEGTYNLQKMAR